MVLVFYNKVLLRMLVLFTGALCGLCAWHYIALSAQKLGQAGVRDALAIVSFLLAGWVVMLIAEVADHHYVRAFGCLCYLLGSAISFRWIFVVDGPRLAELSGGATAMQYASIAFWGAAGLALLMLVILVTRLVLDKAFFGRLPGSEEEQLQPLSTVAAAAIQTADSGSVAAPDSLPPIPLDQSQLLQPVSTVQAAPLAAQREVAPVRRLRVVAGPHSGASFDLGSVTLRIGRQECEILLDQDNQVSRIHAHLEAGSDGLTTLRDNGSTNGSWVNAKRVTEIVLAPGDELRVGTTVFVVEA